MSTPPIVEARLSKNRLALVSLVAALYAPVAVPLALGLDQLALALDWPQGCPPGADHCPPATVTIQLFDLSYGLLILIIPAVGVAIVSGHIALSRMRYASAPKDRRTVALLGLILGYSTFPVLIALYVLAVLTGAISIE